MTSELKMSSSAIESIWTALTQSLPESTVLKRDEPLAKKTTWRVGGHADIFVEPDSESSLQMVIQICQAHGVPWFILGRGSNVLVRDGGFRGVAICLSQPWFQKIELHEDGIWAGAGARQKDVSLFAKKQGIAGFEFLEGIPGSIGGGLRMNAGAMGSEMFDRVICLRTMNREGSIQNWKRDEVEVHYRRCPMLKEDIALGAVMNGTPDSPEAIGERMKSYSEKRWTSQPAASSAGCVFKNPKEVPAGKLVDELGLKGMREGGASVSDVHGNFIVNDQKATANDILNLIARIQKIAREKRGIELLTEIQVVGEDLI
jgi:UDP-N-acetylenolpyruvoylglucosamine reductase